MVTEEHNETKDMSLASKTRGRKFSGTVAPTDDKRSVVVRMIFRKTKSKELFLSYNQDVVILTIILHKQIWIMH